MAYTKTTWTDRVVQYPNKYKDQNNNPLTLTRDEGTITEAGTLLNATVMNNIETGIDAAHTVLGTTSATEIGYVKGVTSAIQTQFNTGWISPVETWVYVSTDDPTGVIKIQADVTTKYSLGMRIKFTNGGNIIYGIITKIGTYGGDAAGYTYITFLHQIDPTDSLALVLMANSAITANYYSMVKVPLGFPLELNKWTVSLVDVTIRKQTSPSANTWYNFLSLSVPIGAWNLSHNLSLAIQKTSNGYIGVYATLSTTNNGASDNEFTANIAISATAQSNILEQRCPIYKNKIVNLTAKTTFYQNIMTPDSGINFIQTQNNVHYDVIKAECIYL